MLHFEMYKGNTTGNLTQPDNKIFDNVPQKKLYAEKRFIKP
jgi:hypothetical protein